MKDTTMSSLQAVEDRLTAAYPPWGCDWGRFFTARYERANFASRYHLVYPGLAFFARVRRSPDTATALRPLLDVMYQGLIGERCWEFWHREVHEPTGAIAERNLTYSGRLAMFVGLYIDAFGEPPAPTIDVDGDCLTYSQLSERLWQQMVDSPSCGVSCYHREAMVMCNAVLMINNVIHDRLHDTGYAAANEAWLDTVRTNLLTNDPDSTLFFYGTAGETQNPNSAKKSLGMDAWALALMSATAPDDVASWFSTWRNHIKIEGATARVPIDETTETPAELASVEYATTWTFCLAAELGETELHRLLDNYLAPKATTGFRVDPYMSGLYLLGHELEPGSLRRLVNEPG